MQLTKNHTEVKSGAVPVDRGSNPIGMEVSPELLKRRSHIMRWTVGLGVLAYLAHVYIATGSFDFITKIIEGDITVITSTVLTTWVVVGWYFIYKAFRSII